MTELEQLRADLEVLDKYSGTFEPEKHLRDRIAQLEAEQADPWREAKAVVGEWIDGFNSDTRHGQVARHVRHLESENERLAARVAELEARPVPPLDPRRVYMTARNMVHKSHPFGCYDENAELYSLAESEDGK
jgi:BMFP domain-containing protein YqiC